MAWTPIAFYLLLLCLGSLICASEPKAKKFHVEKGVSLFAATLATIHVDSKLQCAVQCLLFEACDAVAMSFGETGEGIHCHLKNGSTVAARDDDAAYSGYTIMYAGKHTSF